METREEIETNFVRELKAVLRKAQAAGIEPEQICAIAEFVLQDGWATNEGLAP